MTALGLGVSILFFSYTFLKGWVIWAKLPIIFRLVFDTYLRYI